MIGKLGHSTQHSASSLLSQALTIGVLAMNIAQPKAAYCQQTPPKNLRITSADFKNQEFMPKQFTADGANISPSIAWSTAPPGTKSFAVICQDPDAPNGNWVHWVIYDISPTQTSLPGNAGSVSEDKPFKSGTNSFNKEGWGGPSPPAGKPHRYIFSVYALDAMLNELNHPKEAQLRKAMSGHIKSYGQITGLYQR